MNSLKLSMLVVSSIAALAIVYDFAAQKAAQTGPVILSINELGDTQLTPVASIDVSAREMIAYGR